MFDPSQIGARIVEDNRVNDHCTADPIFVVQQKKRIYGMDPSIDDIESFWSPEDDLFEVEESAEFEKRFQEDGFEPAGYRRICYIDTWEFVQPFFTKAAAERYIEENRHRMKDPRVYVDSAYRNKEWQAVRSLLPSMAKALELAKTVERNCPCGARPESPSTHPHVLGCEVAILIILLGGSCATISGQYQKAVS